jgi:hypothetical protein
MRPRARSVVVLGAATLLASCALSKPLSKEQAAELIGKSAAFTRPKFAHIPRQLTFRRSWASLYGQEGILSISELAYVDPTVAILKLQRLVKVDESIYGPGRGAPHLLAVTPTEIDQSLLLADEDPGELSGQDMIDAQDERPRGSALVRWNEVKRDIGWRVPIGTRELSRVDQIHNWRDLNENIPVNELAVDFTWRWKANEFGDPFDSESAAFSSFPDSVQQAALTAGVRMNTGADMHSRAYLQRVGAEWRLRMIDWSVGRGNPR